MNLFRIIQAGLIILAFVAAPGAAAHEVRPAYLEIQEIAPARYDVLWKTPAQGALRLSLEVILPENCFSETEVRSVLVDGAVIARWRERCEGGLIGRGVGVNNLESTLTDAIFRFEALEGTVKTFRLTPDAASIILPARQTFGEVAGTYFTLGVEHILLGFDHLLFVLALLMLVGDIRRLFTAVTAFTIAHSLTLIGTTLGWIRISSAPVEASIAVSIAFLAAEIVRARSGKPGITVTKPWIASFAFGLLHGFGFAGALREIGLPDDAVAGALLFFNFGVETGQLMFVSSVLILLALYRRLSFETPIWAWRIPVFAIGAIASFWSAERTAQLLGF